jgi:septum formation protein
MALTPTLLLASASPRRARLLTEAEIPFAVQASWVDERVAPGTAPIEAAVELAVRKARAAQAPPGAWVLGADTLLDFDGEILGKPADADDARRILARLSGREHWVLTGVALRTPEHGVLTGLEQTRVTFRSLSAQEIADYVATGEPLDKAGAYGIQGGAARFVAEVRGPMDNVVGLPVALVRRLLAESGFPTPASHR